MKRVMIIPAAGLGTRMRSDTPKVLFPVNGRPMIDHVLDRYASRADRFVLVLHPSFASAVRSHCSGRHPSTVLDYLIQPSPTGMLDAILIPMEWVRRWSPQSVWITWCDQVAVRAETAEALARWAERDPAAAVILPTLLRSNPYIHFERDAEGVIRRVLQRREGDAMPPQGEGDLGLFHLSADAYLRLLPLFAETEGAGAGTQERSFLPFIPWVASQARVRTFTGATEIESVGINTPEDLQRIEAHLRHGA